MSESRIELERRALALVEQAMDLEPARRQGWIDRVTADQPDLRQRLLELLSFDDGETIAAPAFTDAMGLAQDPLALGLGQAPTQVLDRGTGPEGEPGETTSATSHRRPSSGELRVGPYRILGELGRGGMGVVYRAVRDDGSFELAVALKVMQPMPSFATERFEAERRILARLQHENVARILDGGRTAHGSPYLVMELVDGAEIDDYCDLNELTIERRIELFRKVCDAVTHAHRNLVVHRDLKPSNILVTEQGEPKLLDFGIAKLLDADDPGSTMTRLGFAAMTPEYASPEQVRSEPITVATDVYSLGVILYELLVGQRPYEISDRSPRRVEEVVCSTQPPPLSRALKQDEKTLAAKRGTSPAQLSRDLGGDLETIVATALGKEVEDRYSSVDALSEDLLNYLESRPIQARRHTWAYVARRFFARHRSRLLVATLLFSITGAGLVFGWIQNLRAAAQGRRASIEASKLAQTNDFLESLFAAPDPMWGLGSETRVADLLEVAIERLDSEDLPDSRSALRRTIGATYRNLGQIDESKQVLEQALAESIEIFGEDHLETALSRQVLALTLSDLGEYESTAALLERALPVFEREQVPGLSVAYSQYGTALAESGDTDKAMVYYQRALDLNRQKEVPELDDVSALNNYSVFLFQIGRPEEGDLYLEQAIELHRQVTPEPTPMLASLLANLGSREAHRGNNKKAEALYLESIEDCDRLLGADHPQTITTRASLVDLLLKANRLEEAAGVSAENLERATESLPLGHPILAYAQVVHAGVLVAQQKGEQAELLLRAAIEARREALPDGHWLIASAQNVLGAALLDQGRLDDAEATLIESHAVLLEQVGEQHDKTRQAAELLEQVTARRNDPSGFLDKP